VAEGGSPYSIQRHEVFSKFILEVVPVEEAETAGFRLLLKFAGRPAVGASGLHVGHGPNDLSRVVFERFGTEADVGPARR